MPLDTRVVGYVIDGLWLVFALYWLAHAMGNKRSVYRQSRTSRLLFLMILVLLAYVIFHTMPLAVRVLPHTLATQIAGMVLCAAGVAIAIGARRVLGANWSGIVTLKEDHELIRRGPYRFVRHPIYSGVILAFAGGVVALTPTLQGVAFLVVLAAGLKLKSLKEEEILGAQFPEYAQYKREVKALIPFVL
ncbi:MAG TPA: isoprenylcysteine carboxylmethyltransferase family protein [Tepidisphaeraceae bacterium]|jgi:protein-S-isoprenylcysteine O-methyltransferase Ste14